VLAVPLMRAFRQQLPQVSASISEGLSINMQEWLTNGRLDMAVLYNTQPVPGLEITLLYEEELVLVQARPPEMAPHLANEAPPGPITLREIAELPLVIPSRPNAIRMQVEAELARLGVRLRVALEIDGVAAILDLVADGAGAALLSHNAVSSSICPSAYQVRAIVEPPLRTRLCLAISSQRPATLTQQAALALLQKTALQLLQPP
jgi:LysR family nitrogen assimilation transcriptional regulator